MASDNIKFEKALEKLEEIVGNLEGGDLELDESLKIFEEGIKMAKVCQSQLSEAEKKIEKLVKNSSEKLSTAPLDDDSQTEQDELPF